MTQTPATSTVQALAARLARTRTAVRTVMAVERGWPLLLPLVIVICLFLILSWFGVFRVLPDAGRLLVLAALGLAALAALYPLRFWRRPSAQEVDRRIERANALVHEPVRVQSDRPSGKQNAFADALWREHQRRMALRLEGVGGDLPRTRVPERDPWGVRALAALLLVTALAFSFGPLGGTVADGFRARSGPQVLPPRIDAWVTPPAYTGKAPLFLTAEANAGQTAVTVPEGSELSLRVTGGSGEETLAYTDAAGTELVDKAKEYLANKDEGTANKDEDKK